jgi:hypothetical protein
VRDLRAIRVISRRDLLSVPIGMRSRVVFSSDCGK